MEKLEWVPVFYNGHETNVEVTKCGRVRRVKKSFTKKALKIGEVDFTKTKLIGGYKRVSILVNSLNDMSITVHRLVASAFLNYKFENKHNLVVDHIDSNKLNNNLINLRIITNRENCSKERTIKTGLPVGVHFSIKRQKFQSDIIINSKRKFLGYFNTAEEASQAYQNKLKSL